MKKTNTKPIENVSYQEKLDYCLATLKERHIVLESKDKFTKEHTMLVRPSLSQIWSNDDFVDKGFVDLNSGFVQCIEQQLDEANRTNIEKLRSSGMSSEDIELFKSGLPTILENTLEYKREELRNKSTVKAAIGYFIDSADNASTYTLDLDFTNYSHHRDLSSMKIYFKKDNGDVMCLNNEVSVIQKEDNVLHYLIDNALIFISKEQLDFIVESPTLSVRFENVEAVCHSWLGIEDIQKLDFVTGINRSEETTNLLYEQLKEEELQKKIAEEKEKLKADKEKREEAFAKLDFSDIELLKNLLIDPLSIKQYKNLTDFCSKHKKTSSIVSFVESIPEKYNVEQIKAEINDYEKKLENTPKVINRAFLILGILTLVIHCIVFFSWYYTIDELILPATMWATSCFLPYILTRGNVGFTSKGLSKLIIWLCVIIHSVAFFLYVGYGDISFGFWGTYIYFATGVILSKILEYKFNSLTIGQESQDLMNQLFKFRK